MKKVCIFDLDGTITRGDTLLYTMIGFLRKNILLLFLFTLIILEYRVLSKILKLNFERYRHIIFIFSRKIIYKNKNSFEKYLKNLIVNSKFFRRKILYFIFYLKYNKYCEPIIISAAPDFIVEPISKILKIKYISTKMKNYNRKTYIYDLLYSKKAIIELLVQKGYRIALAMSDNPQDTFLKDYTNNFIKIKSNKNTFKLLLLNQIYNTFKIKNI